MKICKIEQCELAHCKQCGHHYDPACSDRFGVCDACIIEGAANEMEERARGFGGNYEEAARFMGW